MELASQIFGGVVGITLEILVIAALRRGGYKRFPILFVYTIANFLTTLIEQRLWLGVYNHEARASYWYQWYYWRDEAVLQLLVFAVVISLIYYATEQPRSRRIVLLVLVPGAMLFAGLSLYIHHRPVPLGWIGVWMTPWMRDIYVVSTVLDLALWAILIAARKKNYQLLLLSGALGIQFTGEAIGESLRNLALRSRNHGLANGGNIVIMLANLTAMWIWWRTFRESSAPKNK